MIAGNKIDIESEGRVPKERVFREYKERFNIDCWEVSAKTGQNVKELFTSFLERLIRGSSSFASSSGCTYTIPGQSLIDTSIQVPIDIVSNKLPNIIYHTPSIPPHESMTVCI